MIKKYIDECSESKLADLKPYDCVFVVLVLITLESVPTWENMDIKYWSPFLLAKSSAQIIQTII